jgi:hypothetical protein
MRHIPASFPDGLSNTIIWTEMYTNCNGPNGQAGPRPWARNSDGYPWEAVLYSDLDADWAPTLPPQAQPNQQSCDLMRSQAFYSGGIMVGLGDGSVRLVNAGVSQTTWDNALTPADGAPLGSDW